jgi:hypothetical protein
VAARRDDIRFELGLVNYPVLTREARMAYWAISEAYLRKIAELCRQHGVPLVLVVIPPFERIDGTTRFDEPYEVLGGIAREIAAPTIELLDGFRGRDPRSLYFEYDRHLRAEGDRLAAQAIAAELSRLGILDRGRIEIR